MANDLEWNVGKSDVLDNGLSISFFDDIFSLLPLKKYFNRLVLHINQFHGGYQSFCCCATLCLRSSILCTIIVSEVLNVVGSDREVVFLSSFLLEGIALDVRRNTGMKKTNQQQEGNKLPQYYTTDLSH